MPERGSRGPRPAERSIRLSKAESMPVKDAPLFDKLLPIAEREFDKRKKRHQAEFAAGKAVPWTHDEVLKHLQDSASWAVGQPNFQENLKEKTVRDRFFNYIMAEFAGRGGNKAAGLRGQTTDDAAYEEARREDRAERAAMSAEERANELRDHQIRFGPGEELDED